MENIVDNQLKLLARLRGRWSAVHDLLNPSTERKVRGIQKP